MRHPVKVERALVAIARAVDDLATIQPQLSVLTEYRHPTDDGGGVWEQLRVFVLVKQAVLDEAYYLIAKLGCSFEAFRCRGVGKGFGASSTFPHETEAERSVVDVDPWG
ncbi:hypothetical protein D3C77_430620 [compost metagenome]